MRVRATRLGYYGLKRMKEGDTFVLHDEKHFSKGWMEVVEDAPAPKKKSGLKMPGQKGDVELLDHNSN